MHDALVIGTEVAQSASAHFFALAEEGGLWAFNYAHDGYADTFHHTGGSRFCQVVGNRAQTSADRGDDFYAFVGYQADGDAVHHCSCIANWGRDGHARGLSAVGAGFIAFAHNDIDRTQWAGIYLAREKTRTTPTARSTSPCSEQHDRAREPRRQPRRPARVLGRARRRATPRRASAT